MRRKGGRAAAAFGAGVIMVFLLARLWGLQVYTVMSGSMEPEIPVGSLVLAGKVQGTSLREGDVIVYQRGESRIIHRIKEIRWEEASVITQGDANEREDAAPVNFGQIRGRLLWTVPWLGYPGLILRRTPGQTVIWGAIGLLTLAAAVRLWRNRSKSKGEEELTSIEGEKGKRALGYDSSGSGNPLPASGGARLPDRQGTGGQPGGYGGKYQYRGGKISGAGAPGSGKVP